jgi:spermidine synthase
MARVAVFLWGVVAAAGQVYLLREYLVASGGNELCIGVFFAAWLLGIAGGALAAGRVSGARAAVWALALAGLGWCAFSLAVLGLRFAPALFLVAAGTRLSALQCVLLGLGAVTPFSAVIGAFFPAASHLLSDITSGEEPHEGVGAAFWVEGAGMAAGSLVVTFVLVPNAGPIAGTWILFAPVFLALAALKHAGRIARALSGALGIVIAAHLALGSDLTNDDWSAARRFDALKTGFARVAGLNTKYARYDLGFREGQYALYINGQFAAAFPDEYSCAARAHLFMTEAGNPERVLVLGTASFCIVAHALEHGATTVDYVETDPELLPFLERFGGGPLLPKDRRVRVRHTDGRAFVKRAGAGDYDLVIADIPDPNTAWLNRYYTAEFFSEVKRVLSARGVAATGITSSVTWLSDVSASHAGCVFGAMRGAFPRVLATVGERSYMFGTSAPDLLTADWKELAARYARSGAADAAFVPESLASFFPEGQVERLAARLADAGRRVSNSDSRPAAYFFNLVLWDWTTGEGFSGRLAGLASFSLWHAAAFLGAIFAVLWLVSRKRRKSLVPASALVASAGFFGMSAEVLCLFEFQNVQGSLYGQVGIVLALYMAGMTAGGRAGAVLSKRGDEPRLQGMLVLAMAGCALMAPGIGALQTAVGGLTGAPVVAAFSLAAAAAGALSGFCFAPAAALFASSGRSLAGTAATVDALDCAGAALGGLLTAVVLIPLLGVMKTAVLAALVCALAAALLASRQSAGQGSAECGVRRTED